MITTGSKLLIGSAVLATVFAVLYGVTAEGVLGTIGLTSAAVALWLLAGIVIFIRDANVPALDESVRDTSAAALPAPPPSPYPLVAAFGATAVAVGLVTFPAITIVGIVALIAATAEWMVQAWADRASADSRYNAEVRERTTSPLELPVLAAILIGCVVYGFSRMMLSFTKSGTVAVFATIAAVVLVVAFVFASQVKLRSSTIVGVSSVALVAVIVGGSIAGIDGERDIHEHETTADLAAEGECTPEETEADEKASQTVAAKSNVAATITLTEAEQLEYTTPGYTTSASTLYLPRSNPNNILFRNDSDEERRLSIDLAGAEDPAERRVICTALVEPGGVQLLTAEFDAPTFGTDLGHNFTVPGVPDASLDVVVP